MYMKTRLQTARACAPSPDSKHLSRVVFDHFHPPPLWSTFPSPPLYTYHHHYPIQMIPLLFSMHASTIPALSWISIPLSFLFTLFIIYSVHLFNYTHPFQYHRIRYSQLLRSCFRHCPSLNPEHYCRCCDCLVLV